MAIDLATSQSSLVLRPPPIADTLAFGFPSTLRRWAAPWVFGRGISKPGSLPLECKALAALCLHQVSKGRTPQTTRQPHLGLCCDLANDFAVSLSNTWAAIGRRGKLLHTAMV